MNNHFNFLIHLKVLPKYQIKENKFYFSLEVISQVLRAVRRVSVQGDHGDGRIRVALVRSNNSNSILINQV